MANNVEIYTKNNCIYCEKVKYLMNTKNVNYKEYKLNEDFTREFIIEKYPDAKTFPIVIVDGFKIGGYAEYANMVALEEQQAKLSNSLKFLSEG